MLNTTHKRKSAVITAVILLLLILGIFNYGMQYLDPPVEYGLAINFGASEVGSGEPVEKVQKSAATKQEEVIKEPVEESSEEKTIEEEVITDDTAKDVPVIEKTKEKQQPVKEVKKPVKPKKKPAPKPSKETTNALNSLLNGSSDTGAKTGEGDDAKKGIKGKKNGDPNSSKYYGNLGSGSGGNYNLSGRKALSKPIKKPDCQEEGTVVVSIEVDQNGKVTRAKAGVKGTTNSAPCLLEPARQAALSTKWNADGNAPSKQRGTIIYKFSLSQ